ncbi:MAG: hypothetical protein LLG02_14090 [Pelosinus sp.]|nr:hypothetical protein [Pelosinus sp.]
MGNELEGAVKQSIPPVGVTTLTLLNIQLADWVYILTMIYLLLQIVYLGMKILRRFLDAGNH